MRCSFLPLFRTKQYCEIRDGENLSVQFSRFPVSAASEFFRLETLNSPTAWRKFLRPVTPWGYRWGLNGLSATNLYHLAVQLMWGEAPPPPLDQLQRLVLNLGCAANWSLEQVCSLSYPDLYHWGQLWGLINAAPEQPDAAQYAVPTPEQRHAALQRTYRILNQLGINPDTGQSYSHKA